MEKKTGWERDPGQRWEQGVDHHPKTVELFKFIADVDFRLCGDYFGWKSGGDGDNGETLMYAMDMFFEKQDAECRPWREVR